ncbi:MAG: hypothetical protein IPM59_12380 [Chloracidobacterium sp.]|nr:hypothetical protein [Chloracidobacterium sp.]
MKFQHGIFDDEKKVEPPQEERPSIGGQVEKNRLFETLKKETKSERSYARLLALVAVPILIVGGAIFYFTLPGYGDRVRPPTAMEMAIRDQMLTKHQRTSTDIDVYYCKDFYWARIGVESRTDVPGNPLAAVTTYTARITSLGQEKWQVETTPLTEPGTARPCER